MNASKRGPSYTLIRLLEGMAGGGLPVSLYAAQDSWEGELPVTCHTGPVARFSKRLHAPYRLMRTLLKREAEALLLRSLPPHADRDIVFTWGEVSLSISRRLNDLGRIVVREKFNCAKQGARAILTEAYQQFDTVFDAIPDELVAKENEELALADAIFCPSPMVRSSLLALGIDGRRLIDTSYGWEPERFAGDHPPALARIDGLTILFVGSICVRKGAHLLLDAWRQAGVRGRLVLVGDLEPLIAQHYADVLGRDDVLHVPFTADIAAYYRAADWFVFPSLEEGGPQVTYEAAGNGLPLLVSPMGAGAFARNGLDGIVVPEMTARSWTDALRSLPDLAHERATFAANARMHANAFTYDKVGARRAAALRELVARRDGAIEASDRIESQRAA